MPWIIALVGAAAGCDAAVDDNTFVPMPRQVTWHEDVQPLLEDACIDCHTAGDEIRLDTYESASAWSEGIVDVALGVTPHVPTELSDDEVDTLVAWHEGGTPLGPVPVPSGEDDDQ
jgi:hypothetical protein